MKPTETKYFFIILMITALLLVFFEGCTDDDKVPPVAKNLHQRLLADTSLPLIDSNVLTKAISNTQNLLNTLNQKDGHFVYRFNLDLKHTYNNEKNNIIRHCGAIYALCELQKSSPDSATKETIFKAIHYLKQYIKPVEGKDVMAAVWSSKLQEGDKNNDVAKLGGSGLGLVAMALSSQVGCKDINLQTMKQVATFLHFIQKKDGSFYSRYFEEREEKDSSWTSLYYPGEAALGWLTLFETDHEKQWVTYANNALIYLALSRKNQKVVPADHWALIALKKLFSLKTDLTPEDRTLHMEHVIQITKSILSQQRLGENLPEKHHGSFDITAGTAPAATRIEGLIAAYTLLPEDQIQLKSMTLKAIVYGVNFLLKTQVLTGPSTGAIPRNATLFPGDSKAVQKLNDRALEVRIDYLQHAVSAFYNYKKLSQMH